MMKDNQNIQDVLHIHQTIIQLSQAYEALNKQWEKDTLVPNELQLLRQEDYHHFYGEYQHFNLEELILSMITHAIDKTVLNKLRVLLERNIQIYRERKKAFGKLNKEKLFLLSQKNKFDIPLAVLYKDKEDILRTDYSSPKEKQDLLNECKSEINRLEKERTGYIHKASWIWHNYYDEIYTLSDSFLSTIESYFFKEKSANSSANDITYFDMKLVSTIYDECNDVQFENIPAIDFYALLNRQNSSRSLIIKSKERIRVCYLIYKLYESLPVEKKAPWREYILKALNITPNTYDSKYKEAASDYASRESNHFAKRIDNLFK